MVIFFSKMDRALSGSAQNVTNLQGDLLLSGRYSKYIRPVQNQKAVLELTVGFHLISILGFDEIDNQLTMKGVLHASWVDEFLFWNPEDYGETESFNVPSNMVWMPNIIMTSSNGELGRFDVKGDNLRLYSNGTLQWVHADVYKSRCLANVKNLPLDVQSCTVYFTAFGYLPTEFRMTEKKTDTFKEEFDNGQWTRDSVSVSFDILPSSSLSVMSVSIRFHRKYQYMLLNILIPIVVLNCLCILVFFVPAECGEKVVYTVTLLLSNTVFLLLLSDNLPKISDPVPTVCVYLIVSMLNSLLICLCTIVNVRIFYRDGEVPKFWQNAVAFEFCCRQNSLGNKVRHADRSTGETDENSDHDVIKCADNGCFWKDVSRKIDRVLVYLFTVFLFIVNITFVIYINIAD